MSGDDRLQSQWAEAAGWWVDDGSADPVYAETIHPMLRGLVGEISGSGYVVDLGCGEGSVAAALHSDRIVGVDITHELLEAALGVMPVVRGRLPHLEWLRPDSVAGAYCVLVLEHLADLDAFFASTATVVEPNGFLVVISNHPAYTAPGAGPLIDMSDGEVLWRWGPYFSAGVAEEPAGEGVITFHHRPLAGILTAAANAGWSLEELIEEPLSPVAIAREPGYAGQEHLPRLMGARWRLTRPVHG